MSTWVITLVVVVVVPIGLVVVVRTSQARKRRGASGGIGLPPIGALTGDEPLTGPAGPDSQPAERLTREAAHHAEPL